MSLVETSANIFAGYWIACAAQWLIFPFFGFRVSIRDDLLMGLAFTVISIIRSYTFRRIFEAIRVRRTSRDAAKIPQ